MLNSIRIAIDLAKNVFQVCTFTVAGKILTNKKVSRAKLMTTIRQFKPTVLAMESCYSANYWGRVFQEMGHDVKLIPAQHVKPFVRGNKNDANDTIAIAEASLRPKLRFVEVKTIAQQNIQMLHRIRDRHKEERTRIANQTRGLLSEYGIIMPKGISNIRLYIPGILEDAENDLTTLSRQCIAGLYDELIAVSERLKNDTKTLLAHMAGQPDYERLLKVPGIGPITASTIVACIGNGSQFNSGRQMSASLGLTPLGEASGERSILKGISKRGNSQLRALYIDCARALLSRWRPKHDGPLVNWMNALLARRGWNKTVVAVANKLARISWVIVNRKEEYDPKKLVATG
jgi:transposase